MMHIVMISPHDIEVLNDTYQYNSNNLVYFANKRDADKYMAYYRKQYPEKTICYYKLVEYHKSKKIQEPVYESSAFIVNDLGEVYPK